MTTATPTFSRGGAAAVVEDETNRSSSFRKIEWFKPPGKGGTIYGHYLYDSPEFTYADAHSGVPTKGKPADWPADSNWPDSVYPTCRYDKAFKGIHADCYVCDHEIKNKFQRVIKPAVKVWNVLVLREEVIATEAIIAASQATQNPIPPEKLGKRVGFKTVMREVEETDKDGKGTGKKVKIPAFIMVQQPVSNYFGGLQSAYNIYGSVVDRDFAITQEGESGQKDVKYNHIMIAETPSLAPGTPKFQELLDLAAANGYGLSDIDAMIADKASDEFYARFIDPNKVSPPLKGSGDGGSTQSAPEGGAPASQQNAAATPEASATDIEAMRARIKGQKPATAAAETPAEPAAAEPAKEPAPAAPAPAGDAPAELDYDSV